MTKAFVVGHPIGHSRSPLIHGHWLDEHGLSGSYERVDVAPADFPEFLKNFGRQGFAGGNVTIPHKEAAFFGVDRKTNRAERLGAVNTLWIEDGLVVGDNTDALGFAAHLDQSLGKGWGKDVDTALVIGAGGAARAVVAALQDYPIPRILVANRTRSKAEDLVLDLRVGSPAALEALAWEDVGAGLAESGLIVNGTSLGMSGQPPLALDLGKTPAGAIVTDIVYVPLKTALLAAAEARGLRVVDGLGMLLHQAAPGFARWFGVTPQVTAELRALIEADIEGRK
jgi:shikimate dehydrogenase